MSAPRSLSALVLTLLLTAGCTVQQGRPSQQPPGSIVVAEDVVRVDFREPLTREEAGLAPGREDRVYDRVGEAIDVEVTLPGGAVLRTPAFGLVVAGPVGVEEPEKITDLTLNVRTGTRAATAARLLEQADLLGLDPARIEQWAAGPQDANGVFEGPDGAFEVSLEARRSSSGDDAWTVDYGLDHRPGA